MARTKKASKRAPRPRKAAAALSVSSTPAAAVPAAEPPKGRQARLQALIAESIRAKHGTRAAVYLGAGEAMAEVVEVLPFGVDVIDRYAIGIGGLPVGRITELASEEGGGKTTLGWSAIASCQREGGGVAAWIDGEHAVSKNRCETMGAKWSDVLLLQPETVEEALDQVWHVLGKIPAGTGPNLIVWDSVAALPTKHELETGETSMAELARVLTTKLRRVGRALVEKRTVLLCINQVRETIGGFKSGQLRTPGGRYFQHAASLRLMLFGGAKVEEAGKRVGKDITVSPFKNRFVEPFRKVRVRLMFRTGWDNRWSTIEYAKDEGLVGSKKRVSTRLYLEASAKLGWPAVDPRTGEVVEPGRAKEVAAAEPEDPPEDDFERDVDDDEDAPDDRDDD